MAKKEQCRNLVQKLIGDAAASQVDDMADEDCVDKTKELIRMYLGETVAENRMKGI